MNESPYRIEFTAAATRQLRRLDRTAQIRILKAVRLLSRQPQPPAARHLKGHDLWRIRIGAYRFIYRIESNRLVIAIVAAGHRSSVYRLLNRQ